MGANDIVARAAREALPSAAALDASGLPAQPPAGFSSAIDRLGWAGFSLDLMITSYSVFDALRFDDYQAATRAGAGFAFSNAGALLVGSFTARFGVPLGWPGMLVAGLGGAVVGGFMGEALAEEVFGIKAPKSVDQQMADFTQPKYTNLYGNLVKVGGFDDWELNLPETQAAIAAKRAELESAYPGQLAQYQESILDKQYSDYYRFLSGVEAFTKRAAESVADEIYLKLMPTPPAKVGPGPLSQEEWASYNAKLDDWERNAPAAKAAIAVLVQKNQAAQNEWLEGQKAAASSAGYQSISLNASAIGTSYDAMGSFTGYEPLNSQGDRETSLRDVAMKWRDDQRILLGTRVVLPSGAIATTVPGVPGTLIQGPWSNSLYIPGNPAQGTPGIALNWSGPALDLTALAAATFEQTVEPGAAPSAGAIQWLKWTAEDGRPAIEVGVQNGAGGSPPLMAQVLQSSAFRNPDNSFDFSLFKADPAQNTASGMAQSNEVLNGTIGADGTRTITSGEKSVITQDGDVVTRPMTEAEGAAAAAELGQDYNVAPSSSNSGNTGWAAGRGIRAISPTTSSR